jgi:hypothetical protein
MNDLGRSKNGVTRRAVVRVKAIYIQFKRKESRFRSIEPVHTKTCSPRPHPEGLARAAGIVASFDR